MSEVRREIGQMLADQLPALDDLAEARAVAAEYLGRVSRALLIVDEIECECRVADFSFGVVPYVCAKHELEETLRGDK